MAGMRAPHLRVRSQRVTANYATSARGTLWEEPWTSSPEYALWVHGLQASPRRRVLSSSRDSIFAELQQRS